MQTPQSDMIVLNHSNNEVLISDIRLQQKKNKLYRSFRIRRKKLTEEWQKEKNLIDNLITIKSQFPNLKVRDQHYIFTDEVIDKVTDVDLILSPHKYQVYAAPYVKVNHVTIHCCKYGYHVANVIHHEWTTKTNQAEIDGWKSIMIKDGFNEKIINKTKEMVDKCINAENWYYEY